MIGHTRVEAHLDQLEALGVAYSLGQSHDVVVRMGVAEDGFGAMEEVLAVDKGHGAFGSGLRRHGRPPKKETRPGRSR